jgi:hypothetical protein
MAIFNGYVKLQKGMHPVIMEYVLWTVMDYKPSIVGLHSQWNSGMKYSKNIIMGYYIH